ncbi:MAG: hypothetical protein IJU69_00220 [Bacteroidales bacterium]|nr:hypothetical protein [Bacteroidales bacterium]
MTISELYTKGHVYLDDLGDVVFAASPATGTVITVTQTDSANIILKHKYYADNSGEVHLDLRDLVRGRTMINIPSGEPYTSADDSWMPLVVKQDNAEYALHVYGYEDGLRLSLTDIDRLRVPRDYRLLLTLPNMANVLDVNTAYSDIFFQDHVRKYLLESVPVAYHDGDILSWEYLVKDLPVVSGRPFRLVISHQNVPQETADDYPALTTPVYEVVEGEFEQYAFLTSKGHYENIPMSGDLKSIPEISFENAQHSSGLVKIRESRTDVYEQNTGWLTRRTAEVLSQLLSSPMIFHLNGDNWERILIESPEVSLSKRDSLHNFTFTWRYVETKR